MLEGQHSRLMKLYFLVVFIASSCSLKGQVSYQPPVIPLVVSIDTNGEISFEVEGEVSFPTPLGTFSAGVIVDPVEKFNVSNVLTIRVDDRKDYFYDLNGADFDMSFESGAYEKIQIKKTGTNLFLEVKRKSEDQSQWFDFNNNGSSPSTVVQNVDFPNPVVTIKVYEDASLGGIGRIRGIVLAGGQPVGNEYVYIQNAEKDVADNWVANLAGSNGYNAGEGDGSFETDRDPGTYLLWLDKIKGNYGISGKVDGWEKQVVPFEVYSGRITEITLHLSVLEVGLTSNGGAVIDGYLSMFVPAKDAAGNLALGEEAAFSSPDNRGYASLIVPAGDYLLQWYGFSECQYFNVSIPVGDVVKTNFDINNPGNCLQQ